MHDGSRDATWHQIVLMKSYRKVYMLHRPDKHMMENGRMNRRLHGIAVVVRAVVVATAIAGCDDRAPYAVTLIPELEVSLMSARDTMVVGDSATFTATVQGDTVGARSGVTWHSTAPGVARVDSSSGLVEARAPGQATIVATSKFRPTVSASGAVTVVPGIIDPLVIAIIPSVVSLKVGEKTSLAAVGDKAFDWTTSDPNVATVSATGEVTATGPGKAVITVAGRTNPTRTATAVITVANAL
jgi:uncharacterized protein YjdB